MEIVLDKGDVLGIVVCYGGRGGDVFCVWFGMIWLIMIDMWWGGMVGG